MDNNLNISLEGKYVILEREFYSGETDLERMFYCVSGFGCSPETSGIRKSIQDKKESDY